MTQANQSADLPLRSIYRFTNRVRGTSLIALVMVGDIIPSIAGFDRYSLLFLIRDLALISLGIVFAAQPLTVRLSVTGLEVKTLLPRRRFYWYEIDRADRFAFPLQDIYRTLYIFKLVTNEGKCHRFWSISRYWSDSQFQPLIADINNCVARYGGNSQDSQ